MPRIYDASRSRRNSYQPVSVAVTTGDTVLKFRFNLCFKIKTVSWIGIVNGIDKFVREAMPIQGEEKASRKPAAKARPILKPSPTSGWGFISVEQRRRIDIGTQESNDLYCSQVSTTPSRSSSRR